MSLHEMRIRLEKLEREQDDADSQRRYWQSEVEDLQEDIDDLQKRIFELESKTPEELEREESEHAEEIRLENERIRQYKLIERKYGKMPASIADWWQR